MPLDAYLGRPLVRPVIYDKAFDDPDRVRAIIMANAPYPCVSADLPVGYGSDIPMRWFNIRWESEACLVNGGDALLHHQPFIDGACASFQGFEIVRPRAVTINLTAEDSGGPHIDLPFFRGLEGGQLPIWLSMTMGYSALFDRWNINIATALSWLYQGDGGGLAYWRDGPDAPPQILTPLHNRVLISDNQRMLHGVLPFGSAHRYGQAAFDRKALLHARADGGWDIREGDRTAERFSAAEIRINLLWTAKVFQNAQEADIYDSHSDDLNLDQITGILIDGAKAKGMTLARPEDPLTDPAFIKGLTQAFPKPQVRYSGRD